MESLESALKMLLEHAGTPTETQELPLLEALHRVAAEDVTSPVAVPPFDRSPLDGYALHSEDIAGASREHPARLRVIGEACAGCGEVFHPARGEAVRVMTGAPVPKECDCVIRQEDTDEDMDWAEMYAPVGHGKNICWAGEDLTLGAVLVHAGEKLTATHLAVLASAGVTRVKVYRRVRVALLCTGDELVQPGQPLPFGKIYDSNRTALTARLMELGAELVELGEAPDDPAQVVALLKDAAARADVILTTGGVSVGKKDIFHQVLPLMGAERLFWRVAMKPGSPLLCGMYAGKLLICLSGNPFGALCCFEVFAVPVLKRLGGYRDVASRRVRTRVRGSFPKASHGRRLIRAAFDGTAVTPAAGNHSSGSLSANIGCNCLIDIPAGTGPLQANDEVEVILI